MADKALTVVIFPGCRDITAVVNGNDVSTCGADVKRMLQEWDKSGAEDLEFITSPPYTVYKFKRVKE